MRTFAILGPGGVGGFLAAVLDRSGATATVVAREPTAVAIERDGLRVTSTVAGDFEAHPRALPQLSGEVDALLVATKSTGLDAALDRVGGLEPRIVVPLLNGLDHMALLRERYGERAVAGAIRIESTRTAAGRIEQTSRFLRIDAASAHPAMAGALAEFADALGAAQVPVRVLGSEAQVLWGKLVRLNSVACATSAWGLSVGEIRADPGRRALLDECVRETAAVARAEGAEVDTADTIAEIDDMHPGLRTSMQRDIEAGRPTELDAIPGAVLRAAARHGLACPTVERLAREAARRAGEPAPVT